MKYKGKIKWEKQTKNLLYIEIQVEREKEGKEEKDMNREGKNRKKYREKKMSAKHRDPREKTVGVEGWRKREKRKREKNIEREFAWFRHPREQKKKKERHE